MKYLFEEIVDGVYRLSTNTDSDTLIRISIDSVGSVTDEVDVGEGTYNCHDDDLYHIFLMVNGEIMSIKQIMDDAMSRFDDLYANFEKDNIDEKNMRDELSSPFQTGRF